MRFLVASSPGGLREYVDTVQCNGSGGDVVSSGSNVVSGNMVEVHFFRWVRDSSHVFSILFMKHYFSFFPEWRTQRKAFRPVSMATASLTPLASPPSKEMSLVVSVETWQTLQMSWMHLQAREDGGSLAQKKSTGV